MDRLVFELIGYLGFIATFIIVLLVTVRSIADVARGMGILPERMYDFFYSAEDKRIKKLLDELGVLPRVKHHRAITDYLDSAFDESLTYDEIKVRLRSVVIAHTEQSEHIVGDTSQISIENFINIRQAFCVSGYDRELVLIMACFIQNRMHDESAHFDLIVGRKGGLDMLGYLVSKILDIPFVLYNDFPAIWEPRLGKTSRSPKHLEYQVPDKNSAIIIDDSCVNATSILQMVRKLRQESIEVKHAFVFFVRSEGDSVSKLASHDVKLHYIDQYDDLELNDIKAKLRLPNASMIDGID